MQRFGLSRSEVGSPRVPTKEDEKLRQIQVWEKVSRSEFLTDLTGVERMNPRRSSLLALSSLARPRSSGIAAICRAAGPGMSEQGYDSKSQRNDRKCA